MIPEKYRVLINKDIDGTNTFAEGVELESYLAHHPEARAYLDEMRSLLTLLESCTRINLDPPPELTRSIMRAVLGRMGKSSPH